MVILQREGARKGGRDEGRVVLQREVERRGGKEG